MPGAAIRRQSNRPTADELDEAADRRRPDPLGFRTYLSLGDSISIDLYPGLDAAEREGRPLPLSGLGAASLLVQNDDLRWPEFAGRDLTVLCPEIRHVDLTEDGATTGSALRLQLPRIPDDLPAPILITLTAGGNDLVGLLDLVPGTRGPAADGPDPARELVEDAARTLGGVIGALRKRFPDASLLVGTVYDPSDGTGDLGDGVVRDRELEGLTAFNRSVEATARRAGARLVPIHTHFLGHGLAEPDEDERWYWHHSIIEPSARGASEVRRLWLEALGA